MWHTRIESRLLVLGRHRFCSAHPSGRRSRQSLRSSRRTRACMAARSIFIEHAGGRLPNDVIGDAFQGWGRYQVVDDPATADLIVSIIAPVSDSGVSVGGPRQAPRPRPPVQTSPRFACSFSTPMTASSCGAAASSPSPALNEKHREDNWSMPRCASSAASATPSNRSPSPSCTGFCTSIHKQSADCTQLPTAPAAVFHFPSGPPVALFDSTQPCTAAAWCFPAREAAKGIANPVGQTVSRLAVTQALPPLRREQSQPAAERRRPERHRLPRTRLRSGGRGSCSSAGYRRAPWQPGRRSRAGKGAGCKRGSGSQVSAGGGSKSPHAALCTVESPERRLASPGLIFAGDSRAPFAGIFTVKICSTPSSQASVLRVPSTQGNTLQRSVILLLRVSYACYRFQSRSRSSRQS